MSIWSRFKEAARAIVRSESGLASPRARAGRGVTGVPPVDPRQGDAAGAQQDEAQGDDDTDDMAAAWVVHDQINKE